MDLTVLNIMRPGDKLEMHYINSENKDLILETLVYDLISEDEIYIQNPFYEHKLYMIPMNEELTCFAKRQDYGVIGFSLTTLGREKLGNVFVIKCKISSSLKKQQRRHFYRVRTYEDMEVYCMVDVQGHPANYYISDPDKANEQKIDFKVSLTDLSGGGARIRSRIELPLGTFIYIKLPILSNPILIHGIVVRCEHSTINENEFEIGIQFENLPNEIIRAITSFVFRTQQKARRRELD